MRRIQEKIKDLIEVRSYDILRDFISNPARTLSIYYFTEITSELMAKYLDKLAAVQPRYGETVALAGNRGVGKTHFLATFGTIASHPELRSKITDSNVASSAQILKRNRHSVAYVKRGTHETLLAELKAAIAETFELNTANLSDDLFELLNVAVARSGEQPFVLLIDTAFERTARVARDDGAILGKIAEIGRESNMFVAVALDDDIAGADGINVAIARNYTINYLDQEHLYRIVNTHIFPKRRQMLPLVHEIYDNFKQLMPAFHWNEQRFTALYPLHPVILETAHLIRLYVPEFALLGFTSEAGAKIMGRPANSLIALDEVFDSVELSLRKIEDLHDAFVAYDKITTEVITEIPVMQRLQAKLVLKGLLLLSLEGDGATAGEIGAAMLIYDENNPSNSSAIVENLLETFAFVFPEDVQFSAVVGRPNQFRLKVGSKENLNKAVAETIKTVSPEIIPKILRRAARERFSDWSISDESENTDCRIIWRGSERRGRLLWNLGGAAHETNLAAADPEFYDWEAIINYPLLEIEKPGTPSAIPKVVWQPAQLRPDEAATILRYYVLMNDTHLRKQFGEQTLIAGHANLLAVERIWNRIFLEEATLRIGDFDYNFSEEARTAQNLCAVFSNMLDPLFEERYPEHPKFAEPLDMEQVSHLANDFFSRARQNLPETQRLAESFALPLGLVERRGDSLVIEREENLIKLPLAQKILTLVKENPEKAVSLEAVSEQLKQSPFGLSREAQRLILTALVAQRRVEFITSKGDRINRRSLDLKIIWDDIEGVAKPSSVIYGEKRLTEWARNLTGVENLETIDVPEDRRAVKSALENWLAVWLETRILERFNELPDDILNTKIWRIATHSEKTFGTVAATVAAISDDSVSLEEGLHRIADAFSDSDKEFAERATDLIILEDFINGARERERIWNYLAVCETTPDEKIERLRGKLFAVVEQSYANPGSKLNEEMMDLWQIFNVEFGEYFAQRHDARMKSRQLKDKFDEILQSDEWWEFVNLSRLSIFQRKYWHDAQKIERQFKHLDCRFDTRELLKTQPFCACSFNLAQMEEWENLAARLEEIVRRGRQNYWKILRLLGQTIVPLLENFVAANCDEELVSAVAHLIEIFRDGAQVLVLTNEEIVILQKIFEVLPSAPVISINFPTEGNFRNSEDLRLQLNDWLDSLPGEPVPLKI